MKFLFKNMISLLIIIVLALAVAACGSTTSTTEGTTTTEEVTTTTEDYPNLGGETIRILHGAPNEVDPFHENYSGQFQSEKQALQLLVEQRYNVDIVYEMYPDGAGWGPDRVDAIIQGVISNKPIGEIYAISSMWTEALADAEAIAPVKDAIRDYADDNYDDTMLDFGTYLDEVYGFETGYVVNDAAGLYFNLDLIEELGLDNPATKWLDGEWTWDDFEAYVDAAQTALASKGGTEDGYYAMGGIPAVWAQHMIPANDGYLINPDTKRVAFDQTSGLQTFSKLSELYNKNLWEITPEFDAGSANWKMGKILLHPGELWFLNADNRWGLLQFDLGFVPYPLGNNLTKDDYKTGKDSMQLYAVSGGYDDPDGLNQENIFRIWNDLQIWQTYDEVVENFEFTLISRYDDQDSIDAHIEVLNQIYVEQIFNLGISGHNADNGWYIVANNAIREGDANTYLSAIKPVYQQELDRLYGNE